MMKLSFRRAATMVAAVATLSGCAGANLGALGDILGGAMGGAGGGGANASRVVAEVQNVDTQRQIIQVRTEQGQTGNVYFDQNTQLVYQQQQYPITALERGDVVSIQLQQTGQNQLYATRIDVQQSVQDRGGQSGSVGSGQRAQVYGRVGQVDYNRGMFQLQTQQGTYTVTLPYNPGASTNSQFQRLRTGDNVRLEGSVVGNGRIELYRFL